MIKLEKEIYDLEFLASIPEVKLLSSFINEINSLKFDETPNYNKLRFQLASSLMDIGITPNKNIFSNK